MGGGARLEEAGVRSRALGSCPVSLASGRQAANGVFSGGVLVDETESAKQALALGEPVELGEEVVELVGAERGLHAGRLLDGAPLPLLHNHLFSLLLAFHPQRSARHVRRQRHRLARLHRLLQGQGHLRRLQTCLRGRQGRRYWLLLGTARGLCRIQTLCLLLPLNCLREEARREGSVLRRRKVVRNNNADVAPLALGDDGHLATF